MLRMIIADDERAIRESINAAIDWKSLDIVIVGLARNGSEAYEMILDESPDIVLTDICMPGFSGLELIARISSALPQTEFIILSGYGEFEYAREAMRWGIKHYLLKPCTSDQLIAVIRSVRADCQHKRMLADLQDNHFHLISTLRKSLLCNMLIEALSAPGTLEAVIDEHTPYLDFDYVGYELLTFEPMESADIQQVKSDISAYFESSAPGAVLYTLYTRQSLFFFFESYDTAYTELNRHIDGLRARGACWEWSRLSFASLRNLLTALTARIQSSESVCFMDGRHEITFSNHEAFVQKAKQVIAMVNSTESKQAQKARVEDLLKETSDESFRRFLIFVAVTHGILLADKQSLYPESALLLARSARHSAVDEVIIYVQNHISNPDISLKWLAENHLFMNADYLSKQFTKQTGEKFSAFLNRTRIERAKEILLCGGTSRIAAVAEEVGLGNCPQYFSHLFKRSTGQTPTEFMESHSPSPSAE